MRMMALGTLCVRITLVRFGMQCVGNPTLPLQQRMNQAVLIQFLTLIRTVYYEICVAADKPYMCLFCDAHVCDTQVAYTARAVVTTGR